MADYFFLQPELFTPLAHVVPLGPCATPMPFMVLASPPRDVRVVVTPLAFFWETAAFPVLGLYAALAGLAVVAWQLDSLNVRSGEN